MEVWDVVQYKLISKPVASDSTYFAWCPDGEHILTATCAPRLRVNNGYKDLALYGLCLGTSMMHHQMQNYGRFLGSHS